jgi:membrane protein implicated in regulation of membrane protease activity
MQPWHWWALGVALVIIEVFAPGFVFLWLGTSAMLIGGILWLLPSLGGQAQWLGFALLAVASVVGWFAWRRRFPAPPSDEILNRRGAQQIGAVCELTNAIRNGRGRIRLGDTTWSVGGPDLPVGARVRVVGVDGGRLLVEPAEPG